MGKKIEAPKAFQALNGSGYLFLALLVAGTVAASAQSHEHPVSAPPVALATAPAAAPAGPTQQLSPELRGLFRDEMVALQGAMLELVPAIVSGDAEATARLAERMRAGYVLAQKLTDAQREELERMLPAAFLERDGEFHEFAGGLADAAREHRAPLGDDKRGAWHHALAVPGLDPLSLRGHTLGGAAAGDGSRRASIE